MSESKDAAASPHRPRGIDPRGPRFGAAITSVLLLIDVLLGLTGLSTAHGTLTFVAPNGVIVGDGFTLPSTTIWQRIFDPAFLLLLVITLLFLWGALSPRTAPWGALYRGLVQPRLKPPTELEDPRPPRFAQGVGLLVGVIGLVLQLFGVPWGLPVAAMAAFVAAFLNAVFGLCLGCQMYLLLQRAGLIGRHAAA